MILHKVIATTGKFDYLTDIDIMFLEHSRSLGDELSVMLYNDHRINLGGTIRGQRNEARLQQLDSLDCVDSVTITTHGYGFRYAPFTEHEKSDLSVGYELEQLRPHLFVTNNQKVWIHNETACEELDIPMQFILMEDFLSDE